MQSTSLLKHDAIYGNTRTINYCSRCVSNMCFKFLNIQSVLLLKRDKIYGRTLSLKRMFSQYTFFFLLRAYFIWKYIFIYVQVNLFYSCDHMIHHVSIVQ